MAEPIHCELPQLPAPLSKPVGFPTPEGILMSTTDAALIVEYVLAMRGWIEAAQPCIGAGK